MDVFWLGVTFTVGLAVGFVVLLVLLRVASKVRAFMESARFVRAGCVYQPSEVPGAPSGWLIRDVTNDDWVLWDEQHRRVLRASDDTSADVRWGVSTDNLKEFLTLAQLEQDHWAKSARSREWER